MLYHVIRESQLRKNENFANLALSDALFQGVNHFSAVEPEMWLDMTCVKHVIGEWLTRGGVTMRRQSKTRSQRSLESFFPDKSW